MKKRVIAVIAVLALSVAMFGCKAGSDTGKTAFTGTKK